MIRDLTQDEISLRRLGAKRVDVSVALNTLCVAERLLASIFFTVALWAWGGAANTGNRHLRET